MRQKTLLRIRCFAAATHNCENARVLNVEAFTCRLQSALQKGRGSDREEQPATAEERAFLEYLRRKYGPPAKKSSTPCAGWSYPSR